MGGVVINEATASSYVFSIPGGGFTLDTGTQVAGAPVNTTPRPPGNAVFWPQDNLVAPGPMVNNETVVNQIQAVAGTIFVEEQHTAPTPHPGSFRKIRIFMLG